MGSPIRIGVTSNARRWAPSWWCIATALRLAGATPRRITVRDPAPGEAFDALVVSGGDDIGPDLYGGAELPKARIDHERDALEVRWLRWAMDRHVPVLGICRGAQLLNAVRGGSLLQDITALRRRTSNRASLLPRKPVTVTSDSRLAAITARTRLHVNSLHHQAIDRPGDGLEIVARDGDDICQAIESSAGPALLGVQWHPEYLLYLPSHLALFRSLVERAREHRSDSPEPKTMAAASLAPAARDASISCATVNREEPGNGEKAVPPPEAGHIAATLERPLPLYGHHGQRLGTVERVHICGDRISRYELVTPWQRLQIDGSALAMDHHTARLRRGENPAVLHPPSR